jgi:glycosyltransferase involved in cell wall biosynthesis
MKVAYILAEFVSSTERFVTREIDGLSRNDVEVHVFALRRGMSTGRLDVAPRFRRPLWHPALLKAVIYWLAHRPRIFVGLCVDTLVVYAAHPRECALVLRNIPVAADFARQAATDGVEHIHAHFAYIPADIAHVMSRLLDLPFSVSAHAWDIYTQPPSLVAKRLRDATAIITCTEEGRHTVQRALPPDSRSRLETVRHGLHPSEFDPDAGSDRVVLGIGRLIDKKGFDILLAACGALRKRGVEFEAAIIGDGPLKAKLETMASALQLRDVLTFTGELPWRAVRSYLRRGAVLVAPSVRAPDGDRDGLPNVVLEAMASGRPVITTRESAAPEIVVDGENGFLVDRTDAQGFADHIQRLLDDDSLRRTMGKAARRTVTERFDIEKTALEMVQIFRQAKY